MAAKQSIAERAKARRTKPPGGCWFTMNVAQYGPDIIAEVAEGVALVKAGTLTVRCSACNLPIERGEIVHETRDHQPRHAKCCECVGREKGDRRAPVYRVVDD